MFQYKCLNPISQTGLGLFGEEYKAVCRKWYRGI